MLTKTIKNIPHRIAVAYDVAIGLFAAIVFAFIEWLAPIKDTDEHNVISHNEGHWD